jgi:5-methylcytosine-specific restriction endonuclease McrA
MKRTGFKMENKVEFTKPWYFKEADKLLTPIIKAKYPRCLFCPNDTQVAHHFIKKSESNRLRYCIDNLVNLCNPCHFRLHNHESFWSAKIMQDRGIEWFDNLEELKKEFVHTDLDYYKSNYERLKELLENGMM